MALQDRPTLNEFEFFKQDIFDKYTHLTDFLTLENKVERCATKGELEMLADQVQENRNKISAN